GAGRRCFNRPRIAPPRTARRCPMAANRHQVVRSLRFGLLVAGVLGLATEIFACRQVERERRMDLEDVSRRARTLAQPVFHASLRALALPNASAAAALRGKLEGYRGLLGYAVFRPDGQLLAAGKAVTVFAGQFAGQVKGAARTRDEVIEVTRTAGMRLHVLALPLRTEGD